MPARRHDLHCHGRQCIIPQRRGRLAVAELAIIVAPGREEDLEPAQAAPAAAHMHLARQGVQGLEGVPPGDDLAAAAGVQGEAELCGGEGQSSGRYSPYCGVFWLCEKIFWSCIYADLPLRFGNDAFSVSYTCWADVRLSTTGSWDENPKSAATICTSHISM